MPSIYRLKPAFQQLLQPIIAALIQRHITPNQVTLLALVLSFAGGALLVLNSLTLTMTGVFLGLPIILLVRMALNALDGMLARQHQLSSPLGEILNELGDVVADIALYLPLGLYLTDPLAFYGLVGFVLLAMLTEFCGVLGKVLGVSRRYDGPMGKSDRAFVVGLLALALFFWPQATVVYAPLGLLGLNLLLVLTCWNRLRGALQERG